jgi:hypothetical protein
MRTWPVAAALLLAFCASAEALLVAPPSVPARVAVVDRVLVGKVTKLSEKPVPAELNKGDRRDMRIATVAVGETLLGPKAKEVRVGFLAAAGGAGGRPARRAPALELSVGQAARFYLTRLPWRNDV